MDADTWRWIWVGAAAFLTIGEMLTAGFFMLPFAAGAIVAAILAWFGVAVGVQWVLFLLVSLGALFGLRRFVQLEDEERPTVGANRFTGQRATVIEAIDPVTGAGRVRLDTEHWRATSSEDIPVGAVVRVTDVRGARLVVESITEAEESEQG